jgi:hypothetical protein
MKLWIASALLIGSAILLSAPAMAAGCTTGCTIQTKKPSPKNAGKFDYVLVCIDDFEWRRDPQPDYRCHDVEAKALAKKKC